MSGATRERFEKWADAYKPYVGGLPLYGGERDIAMAAWQAATADMDELMGALRKYYDAIDAIYNESAEGRAMIVKHLGTLHPISPEVLARYGKLEGRGK